MSSPERDRLRVAIREADMIFNYQPGQEADLPRLVKAWTEHPDVQVVLTESRPYKRVK